MSSDKLTFRQCDLTSINRYVYASNNPYRYVDPTGKSSRLKRTGGLSVFVLEAGTIGGRGSVAVGETMLHIRGFTIGLSRIRAMGIPPSKLRYIDDVTEQIILSSLGEENATNDETSSVDAPVPEAEFEEKTRKGTKIWGKSGGLDQANEDFDDMNLDDVEDKV